jgi:transposase-like protein
MAQAEGSGEAHQQEGKAPNDCGHQNLVKAESRTSDVDPDVQIYLCAMCRRSFTVNAY